MDVVQVVSVVGSLGANEDVVMLEDLLEGQLAVVIIVGRSEKMLNFLFGYLAED